MSIRYWSSDVFPSDLQRLGALGAIAKQRVVAVEAVQHGLCDGLRRQAGRLYLFDALMVSHESHGQALRIHSQGWLNINTGAAPSGRFVEQFAPDQHTPDFAGAGADLVQLGVAPQAAGGVVVDIAVAAQYLYAFAGHPGGFFRSEEQPSELQSLM